MYQRGRPVVPEFYGDESLHLRYRQEHWVEGQLDPAGVRFPRTSVNRSTFSEPEDALFSDSGRYNGFGVVRFIVSNVPMRVAQSQGSAYVFFMVHAPLDDNYSHSEIWSDHEHRSGQYKEPSKTVKLKFRILLCQKIRREHVCIEAVL
jgi:hypothetical protein